MTRHRILRSLLICSAALATANCAAIQRHFAWLHMPQKVAPRLAASSTDVVKTALDDSFYGDAVKAIDRRDYGNALELLQAARERSPSDVRVLNAFGVVYDKLGRFDLSGRYYAQASTLDPGSTIVANNEAYSRVLQARAAVSTRLAASAEAPPVAAAPVVKPVQAPTVIVASAAPVAPKVAALKPAPLQVSPVFAATIRTVSYQLQALQSPRLPSALFDRTPETAVVTPVSIAHGATPAPLEVAAYETVSLDTVSYEQRFDRTSGLDALQATHGPAPAPLQVAGNETVSLDTVSYDQTFDRSSGLDAFQTAQEPALPRIAPAIAATLQTAEASAPQADALAPQMGRVVPDGPGRVRLVPAPRSAAPVLAYTPKSVMTLEGPAARVAGEGPALLASNGRIVEVAPGVLRLEVGAHPTMVALDRAPGVTGYPLAVIDASGRTDGAKVTITRLASLGWTARIAPPTPSRQHSTIYYQAGDIEVAQGLARTLSIPVQLAVCEQACRGVTLVVGADALDHRNARG